MNMPPFVVLFERNEKLTFEANLSHSGLYVIHFRTSKFVEVFVKFLPFHKVSLPDNSRMSSSQLFTQISIVDFSLSVEAEVSKCSLFEDLFGTTKHDFDVPLALPPS